MNKEEFLEEFGYNRWTVSNGVLVCPCGHKVEDDGECPNGHESPLKQEMLI